MTKVHDININFLNLKTELHFNNYAANTDTINKSVTIVSQPSEKIIPLYIIKDISLLQEKQITQAIRQEQ
jgi:hypothetical protein